MPNPQQSCYGVSTGGARPAVVREEEGEAAEPRLPSAGADANHRAAALLHLPRQVLPLPQVPRRHGATRRIPDGGVEGVEGQWPVVGSHP